MGVENGDQSLPDGGAQPAQRRPLRRLADLASLYEAVDQIPLPDSSALAAAAAPPPPPARRKLPDLSLLDDLTAPRGTSQRPDPGAPAAPEAPAQVPPARRKLPDLSLLDDLTAPREPAPDAQPAAPGRGAEDEEAASGLVIDPDLEKYIYPDLWRKLNSPAPSRGILINSLDQVRSVLNLLSTFLPQHLVQEKMRRAVPGLVSGQMLSGTLLFSDVSGFTTLSERLQALGPKGAEQLTGLMNRYFSQMLEILNRSGGILLKFAGDAMLVYFQQQDQDEQVNWAVRVGQRMLSAMTEFADLEVPGGKISLKMKIGIGTGDYLAASVGTAQRMEYVVFGPAVAQTMTAESLTTAAGQVVVNAQTLPFLNPAFQTSEHKNGYYRVSRSVETALDDFEIKAEVRRARGALMWDASPQAIMAQVDVSLHQIRAILPYLSQEVVDRVVIHGKRSMFASQYRPTTVLFCNFWGVESLLAGWGSEGVSRVTGLLNAYFCAMSEVVARFGGMISRIDPYSKGTKMLILFGAPVAHEDDAQRAVSTALAMNVELETINENWRRKLSRHLSAAQSGPLLQHRIGITTGRAFAGQVGSPTRREYTVMGDEVNLSARLMGVAEAGQILVSMGADVQAQLAAYFHLTALAPMRVKGKVKPVAVFQVQGPRDDLLSYRAHERGALIGRKTELARAEALLQQARAGRGAILVLEGPAGIGKSHLADALIQRAEAQDALVLLHQCRSYSTDTPYNCWSLLLRTLAGISTTDYQAQAHYQKLNHLIQECRLAEELVQPLALLMGLKAVVAETAALRRADRLEGAAPVDETGALADQVRQGQKKRQGKRLDFWDQLDGGQASETGQVWQPITAQLSGRERETTYAAVRALLLALTQPRSGASRLGVIFFEDAHWMDPASQDLLRWIESGLRDLPLLILLARRKGDDRGAPPLRAQTISLAPLTADETSTLVSHLLIADLAQVIHEQSQGNPLFVEEITRWYKQSHQISSDELRSVLQTSNFLQKLILSRLESLPDELQEVAMVASVIGNEFRTGEVQALLSVATDAVTLSNHLRTLARSHLIALVEAGADARYTYQQSLVRDILYNSLPFEKRRELHGKLGDYLGRPMTRRRELQAQLAAALEASADNPVQSAEAIAGHYELAERWLDAARQFWLTGDQARQQGDAKRALANFDRALAALDRLPAAKVSDEARQLKSQLYVAQGDLAFHKDANLSALMAYEAARATLDPDAAPEFHAALVLRFALVLPTQRRADEAESMLRALLAQPGFTPGLEFLAVLAWISARAGRADAPQWAARCQERLEEAGGGQEQALRALLADLSGSWARAQQGYLEAGYPAGAAAMSILLGQQALEQGDAVRAANQYQQAHEISRQAGHDAWTALACYRLAEVRWRDGQLDDARAQLERCQAALEKAPSQLTAEGFTAVRSAQKAVQKNKLKQWPNWPVQNLVDQYSINLLSYTGSVFADLRDAAQSKRG